MKNIAQTLNILLASALVIYAIKITFLETQSEEKKVVTSGNAYEVIMTRNSVRSYEDKAVEQTKIDSLLRAAMAAPTAGNKQPWAYVVVQDRKVLDELSVELPHTKMMKEAPLAIIVCGDLTKTFKTEEEEAYWVQDVAASSQNILLAAKDMGLGTVWTGVYPVMERVKQVQKKFNLPEHIIPLNVIAVGYPKGPQTVKDKFKTENIHYGKW